MRVTLATTAPGAGGVARHVLDLGTELGKRGHEVKVACRADAEQVREAVRQHGFRWTSLGASLAAATDVWHLHLHNTLDNRALPLLLARRLGSRGAVVLTEHLPRAPRTDFEWAKWLGPQDKGKPGAATAKLLMKQGEYGSCDAVIAVSGASADFMARRWRVGRSRLTVIHNGVPVPELEPVSEPTDGPLRVVAVGALHKLKGFDLLLEAASLASVPWSILIIGDGPDREQLVAQAAALPGQREVTFTGWRPNAALAALEGDVFCSPSRTESFSYVILEAMAVGRPVVATAVDGAAEAVRDGETGLLVPPEDPERLAEALDGLALDRARWKRMGEASRERVAAEFEIGRMVEKTIDAYKMALSRRRRCVTRPTHLS